ncbi:MAG: hypothetical protein HY906_08005, partial [Deltaproteobacteria bacterium]|nr:hypothetical protein [Deltaproteobacteria bacterium]
MKIRVVKIGLLSVLSAGAGLFLAMATCESETGVPPPEGQVALAPGQVPGWADPIMPPPIASVYLAASDEDAEAGNYATQFPALETRDLLVVTFWEPRAGTHVERLEFHTPQGALYQILETAFTSDAERGPAHVKLEGRIAPLPVRHIQLRDQSGARVVARLPVSGTPIMSNLVTGTWTV